MIINSLSLIFIILTIVSNIALFSFITVIISNKKLIREKSNEENFDERNELNITTEFECTHDSDSHNDKKQE